MFTLIYFNGAFNRPDTLLPFLESNVGKDPLMQIDCVTPYHGSEQDLINEVCEYLNGMDPHIEVSYNVTISKNLENSIDCAKVQLLCEI
jgi:hypothetical protein